MYKSLLKELRFEIGEQYEVNEFNLKSIESTFRDGLEYENYIYIKDDIKTFLGLKLKDSIILEYNGDILAGMRFEFKLEDLSVLVLRLNSFFPKNIKLKESSNSVVFRLNNTTYIKLKIVLATSLLLKVYKISG